MKWGITPKGFVMPTFQDIYNEEKELFWVSLGRDIDLANDTPEGAYVGNQARKKYELLEALQGLWFGGDPDAASGVYLDRLAGFVNVYRISAQATLVFAALYGEEKDEIPAGQISETLDGDVFCLTKKVTISKEKLLGFYFGIDKVEEAEYLIAIDGKEISYTADEHDDEESIQEALFQALDDVFPDLYAAVNKGKEGMVIHSKAGQIPFALYCGDDKIKILLLGAYSQYEAVIPGPTFVPVGSLRKIISKANFKEIINYSAGITGRNAESDTELRFEMRNRQKQASGNEIAIENAIKTEVRNVRYARVYSNRSIDVVDGMPPKSFEAVVVGGDDREIAQKILDKGPAGIEAFGSTEVTVQDIEDRPWPIGFTRPKYLYVWGKIFFILNEKEKFPINGPEMIKEKVDVWGSKNLGVGVDLMYQRLDTPVHEVAGVRFALIKLAVTETLDPPHEDEYVAADVSVNKREIAVLDRSRLEVRELG